MDNIKDVELLVFVFMNMFDLYIKQGGWVDGDVCVCFDMFGKMFFVGKFDVGLCFVESFIFDVQFDFVEFIEVC